MSRAPIVLFMLIPISLATAPGGAVKGSVTLVDEVVNMREFEPHCNKSWSFKYLLSRGRDQRSQQTLWTTCTIWRRPTQEFMFP